jgi:methionyl aminopeptidase
MSIEGPDELEGMRAVGRVVAETIRAMRREVRPGISTAELDRTAARTFARAGARSGPNVDYGFPGTTCISVNDEAVHGIPGPRRLKPGDLVKLDVTAVLDGFYADACLTVPVGRPNGSAISLARSARRALAEAMRVAKAGAPINAIGASIERTVHTSGHRVCADLMGHGIGRRIHEPPDVPSAYREHHDQPLTEGLVMTIEPIVSAGSGAVVESDDGWTIRTADRALSAHAEHTIVVTNGAPIVLTA